MRLPESEVEMTNDDGKDHLLILDGFHAIWLRIPDFGQKWE
jgi:hypothetical protein